MKKYIILLLMLPLFFSCKKKVEVKEEAPKASVSDEKIIEQLKQDENFASQFDFPDQTIYRVNDSVNGVSGFFVITEKTKKKEDGSNDVGLAYFEQINGEAGNFDSIKVNYKMKFNNVRAFMNNDHTTNIVQKMNVENDIVTLSIEWGPTVHKFYDKYTFGYELGLKRWALKAVNAEWTGGSRNVDTKKFKIYLDNYNVSELVNDVSIYLPKYTAKDLAEVKTQLRKVYADSTNMYRVNPVLEADIKDIVKGLNDKNAAVANDCAFYLEQMNFLDQAEILLKVVIAKSPKRSVAYLNMGDVYRKQDEYGKAESMYSKYISLMRAEGKANKIPSYVLEYTEDSYTPNVETFDSARTHTPPVIYGD